jgi:thiamine biosynthesis lipoprotein
MPAPAKNPPTALPAVIDLDGTSMGTRWSVRLRPPTGLTADTAHSAITASLARVVAQMSTWDSGSDLSRYNRAAPETWVPLPWDCLHVIRHALAWAEVSGGAFDPTVGPAVNLWGFGPETPRQTTPADSAVQTARACIGWHRLRIDDTGNRLWQPGGSYVDLSAIAKGYAVDLLVDALHGLGCAHALVEVGGELRALGRRADDLPWQVAVSLPDVDPRDGPVLALQDLAVATSGDAFHAFEQDGQRYAHTLDPRLGTPLTHRLSAVTVLHPSAMQADALATVLNVLGPEDGPRFAEDHGIAALFVARDATGQFQTLPTPLFLSRLI